MKIAILTNLLIGLFLVQLSFAQNPKREYLYAGTFTERGSEGIYVFYFDPVDGQLNLIQKVAGKLSPSFLDIDKKGENLYAVYREGMNKDDKHGSVAAYQIDSESGRLALINEQSSEGESPCHISVDPKGDYVYVSHYGNGSFVVLPILKNGGLEKASDVVQIPGQSVVLPRQSHARTHSALPSKNGKYVYVADLGVDKVLVYSIDRSSGKAVLQSEAAVTPGAGPRHYAIHPKGKFGYLAEEMTSTIAVFIVNSGTGALEQIQRLSALPEGYEGNNSCADIHTDPDGNFLYTSNRGHNSLAVHAIDQSSGMLSYVTNVPVEGDRPRNFMIHDSGMYVFVANRQTDEIVIFKRIQESGELVFSGERVKVPGVVCLKMTRLK
jgi:6-phosphogluconolactonase